MTPGVSELPSVLFVTGTDTGVGKTIVTAALAAALTASGRSVAVYKPTQAGLENGAGDIDVVRRLAAVEGAEGIRLPDPMAPVAAAARAGLTLPSLAEHIAAIRTLSASHDHTLVEGAGGVLVALTDDGGTLADIASAIAEGAAIIVCRAGLGTLNHTELTIEALDRRGVPVAGLVLGSWPGAPSEIDLSNRGYLSAHAVQLLGAVAERAGALDAGEFRAAAPGWFA
jgi:dethiobiotin synthetase